MVAPPIFRRRSLTLTGRLGLVLALIAGGAAIGATTQQFAAADVTSGDRPVFVPIDPCRLADTRSAPNNVGPRSTPIGAAESVTFTAHGSNGDCTIPADAVGLSLNITALGATTQTFLTVWPDGDRPLAASLNPSPGQPPTPNAVNAPLSSAGSFNIYNDRGSVHTVIDVNGYYAHHDHDDRYYTQAEVDALIATTPTTQPSTAPPGGVGQIYGRLMQNTRMLDNSRFASPVSAIEIDPSGRPIVAYLETFTTSLYLAACDDIACVNHSVIGAGNDVQTFHDMTLDAHGDPVLVYSNTAGGLVIQTCLDRCAGITTETIGLGHGIARVTIAPNGNPLVGFFDAVTQSNKLVVCADPSCSVRSTTLLDVTTGAVGSIDVTIGSDGFPVIALYSTTNNRLDVIACRTADCEGTPTPVRTTVDDTAGSGRTPVIVIGADGNPLIAFGTSGSGDLKLARCVDPTCSTSATLTTVSSAGDVGDAPDMVIAATGFPVISHMRYVNGVFDAVLVEVCRDIDCSATDTVELGHGPSAVGTAGRIATGANGAIVASWVDHFSSRILMTHVAGLSSTFGGWD